MVDLLISSSIPLKLKNKLAIVQSIQSNENEDSLGQVPFFLLKSVAFLEALTAMISNSHWTRKPPRNTPAKARSDPCRSP